MRSITSILLSLTGTILWTAAARAQADPQDPRKEFPWEGEITATNVYVRSAAGTNWYQTTKLGPGARVLVTGEKFGWYEVVPPEGSFSYIVTSKVDADSAGGGTVIDDRVKVFAGSHLTRDKTAVQTLLNRGARVRILGEADGFYKIAPPPGARLFISSKYVEFVPPNIRTGLAAKHAAAGLIPREGPAANRPTGTEAGGASPPAPAATPAAAPPPSATGADMTRAPSPVAGDSSASADLTATPGSGVVSDRPSPSPAAARTGTGLETGLQPIEPRPALPREAAGTPHAAGDPAAGADPSRDRSLRLVRPGEDRQVRGTPPQSSATGKGRYDAMLTIVESELQAELAKPLMQQNLSPLAARYEEIMNQSAEPIAAQVARIRHRQVQDRAALQRDRQGFIAQREDLDAFRARLLRDRQNIGTVMPAAATQKPDLEGQLMRSLAFPPEMRRLRLVDPVSSATVAYVDIPPSVAPDLNEWIGRYVGIRTAGRQFSPSARVTIAVAAQIVDLAPTRPEDRAGTPGAAASASDRAHAGAPPSTERAAGANRALPARSTGAPESEVNPVDPSRTPAVRIDPPISSAPKPAESPAADSDASGPYKDRATTEAGSTTGG